MRYKLRNQNIGINTGRKARHEQGKAYGSALGSSTRKAVTMIKTHKDAIDLAAQSAKVRRAMSDGQMRTIQKLKEAMPELTQAEIGQKLGVTRQTVIRLMQRALLEATAVTAIGIAIAVFMFAV